jgi:hypothetical protein
MKMTYNYPSTGAKTYISKTLGEVHSPRSYYFTFYAEGEVTKKQAVELAKKEFSHFSIKVGKPFPSRFDGKITTQIKVNLKNRSL